MAFFERLEDLEEHLKHAGVVVVIPERPLHTGRLFMRIDIHRNGQYPLSILPTNALGEFPLRSDICVSLEMLDILEGEAARENSVFRRLSNLTRTRSFVYLDISDFSRMDPECQLLVVNALVKTAEGVQKSSLSEREAEAQLCIGDGYIYVFERAEDAARFAGNLAIKVEKEVAGESIPEFHFRIGAHVGEVRCFWDPGRQGWNYVGDGINGGNRVLSAIGKDTDDVVFFSGELRSAISNSGTAAGEMVKHLSNRGRKADKHGNLWRVYELNHFSKDYF